MLSRVGGKGYLHVGRGARRFGRGDTVYRLFRILERGGRHYELRVWLGEGNESGGGLSMRSEHGIIPDPIRLSYSYLVALVPPVHFLSLHYVPLFDRTPRQSRLESRWRGVLRG